MTISESPCDDEQSVPPVICSYDDPTSNFSMDDDFTSAIDTHAIDNVQNTRKRRKVPLIDPTLLEYEEDSDEELPVYG